MNPQWRSRYEVMVDATRTAGKVALSYYDRGVDIEWKHDQSPVTVADRETERTLRESLQKNFPDDGFLGEEFDDKPGTSGYRWIIDPIDGTRCFIRGIDQWATLVGLEYKGEMIAGVAYEPKQDRMYRALRGDGACRDDRKIRVSTVPKLNETLACYSSYSFFRNEGKEQEFIDILRSVDRSRGYGDYYGFVLLAQGSIDLMVDLGVHIWDIAAIQPIIEEAGGKFTDWDGGNDLHRPDCLGSNGLVHEEALRILNRR